MAKEELQRPLPSNIDEAAEEFAFENCEERMGVSDLKGAFKAGAQWQKQKNALEVKEVNLEKESELIANEIMIGVQANKYHTNIYNTERNDFNHSHLMLAARKGIELGLNTNKGE